jgi:hypothetical protein
VFGCLAKGNPVVTGIGETGIEETIPSEIWKNATSTDPSHDRPLVQYADRESRRTFGGSIEAVFIIPPDGTRVRRRWDSLRLRKSDCRQVFGPLLRQGILARWREGRITSQEAEAWSIDLLVGPLPPWPDLQVFGPEWVDELDAADEPRGDPGYRKVEQPSGRTPRSLRAEPALIELLVKGDGPVDKLIGGTSYHFEHDEHGRRVTRMWREDHIAMVTADGVAHVFREVWLAPLEWLTAAVKASPDRRIEEGKLLRMGKDSFPTFDRGKLRALLPKAIEAAGFPAAWTKSRRPRRSGKQ